MECTLLRKGGFGLVGNTHRERGEVSEAPGQARKRREKRGPMLSYYPSKWVLLWDGMMD